MPKFGNPMGKVPKAGGKGVGHAMLPNREAVAQLTKGNPMAQQLGNYAKMTPSGMAGMTKTYPEIMREGEEGASVFP